MRNYRKTQSAEAILRKQGLFCVKLHFLTRLRFSFGDHEVMEAPFCFGDRECPLLLSSIWGFDLQFKKHPSPGGGPLALYRGDPSSNPFWRILLSFCRNIDRYSSAPGKNPPNGIRALANSLLSKKRGQRS